MFKKFSFFLSLLFLSSCVHSGNFSKKMDRRTPYEFYAQQKSAVDYPLARNQSLYRSAEFDPMMEDTRGEKANVVIISILAGAAMLAGIIVPILVLQ